MKIFRVSPPWRKVPCETLFITDICCGTYHSLALTSSGDIYSWGANKYGQIGIGSDRDCQPKPKKMKYSTNEKFKAISYGCYHSMALTEDGRVFACGYNEYGQLGDRTFEKSNQLKHIEMYEILIKKISCGATVSLLLSTDGDIQSSRKHLAVNCNRKSLFWPC